jgi:flagellin-like protein
MNPQKRKAVSPVIATVILVAVAITVSVGVSYWMGGISSQYTQFEKIEIQTGYATYGVDGGGINSGWNISLSLKNSGSASSTITHVFVNDKPVDLRDTPVNIFTVGELETSVSTTGVILEAGQSKEVYILVDDAYENLSSGTTVNIKLHSAGGMDYIKLIRLT